MSLKDEFEQLKLRYLEEAEGIDSDPENEDTPEYEEVDGFNVLILTSSTDSKNRRTKKNPTVTKIENWCKSHDVSYYTAFVDTAYLKKDDEGVIKIYNVDDKDGCEIDRDKTFIIARRGVVFHRYSLNIMTRLERYRFCFLNERNAIETCEDKYMTTLRLEESKIPTPETSLVPTENMIDLAHEQVGGKFPVVVKTLNGTQGKGVFIVNEYKALKSTLQAIWSVGDGVEMMLQKYIKSEYDVRIHVLGDEVIAAMKRVVVDNDFRSNVHLGGKTMKYKPTKEIKELAIKSAKSVKCKWAGVDIMFDSKGNPYVLEVNASPGTDGIEELTNEDIVGKVMEFSKNAINWNRPSQEIGVVETIEIDGIGQLHARFDTGNSSDSSSLDAQDIKMDKDSISWVTNGKRLTSKKIKDVRMKSNTSSDEETDDNKRPVVSLDITFEGVNYNDVLFNLNDRSHKTTPVLINKDFMIRSGSVINPSKVYSVTSKPDYLKKKRKKKFDKVEREEN
jgi:RimK family alpha-L-glutamate ligase